MKQFLFPMLVGLMFSQFTFAQTKISNQDSKQYILSQKLNPAITISPSQHGIGYYRDVNGVIQEYEGNESVIAIDTTSAYYRMIKRNDRLTENKFTKLDRIPGGMRN